MANMAEDEGPPMSVVFIEKHNYSHVVFSDMNKSYKPGTDVTCKYILSEHIHPRAKDWIGIFKVGWTTVREYYTFVWAPEPIGSQTQQQVVFKAYYLPKDDEDYQFLYVDQEGAVRGASGPFQFRVEPEDDIVMVSPLGEVEALEEQRRKILQENQDLKKTCELLLKEKADAQAALLKQTQDITRNRQDNSEDLQSKNGDLQSKNRDLQSRNEDLLTKNGELQSKNEDLQSKIEDLQSKDGDLQSKNEDLQSRNEDLQSRNEDLQRRNQDLQSRNEDLQSRNEDLQSRNEDLQSKNGDLQSKNGDLQSKNEDLQSKNEDLQSKNGDLQSKNKVLQSKNEELQSQNEDLQRRNGDLQTQNGNLQSRNGDLQTQNGDLQTQNGNLQSRNGDLQIQNGDLQSQNIVLQSKNRDLQSKNEDLQNNIKDLQNQNLETENIYVLKQELQKRVESLMSREQKLELKVKSLKEEEEVQAGKYRSCEIERNQLKDQIQKIKAERDKLENNLRTTLDTIDMLKVEKTALKKEIEAVRDESLAKTKRLQDVEPLQRELRDLRAQNTDLEAKQRQDQQKLEAAKQMEAALQQQLSKNKLEISHLTKKVEDVHHLLRIREMEKEDLVLENQKLNGVKRRQPSTTQTPPPSMDRPQEDVLSPPNSGLFFGNPYQPEPLRRTRSVPVHSKCPYCLIDVPEDQLDGHVKMKHTLCCLICNAVYHESEQQVFDDHVMCHTLEQEG